MQDLLKEARDGGERSEKSPGITVAEERRNGARHGRKREMSENARGLGDGTVISLRRAVGWSLISFQATVK